MLKSRRSRRSLGCPRWGRSVSPTLPAREWPVESLLLSAKGAEGQVQHFGPGVTPDEGFGPARIEPCIPTPLHFPLRMGCKTSSPHRKLSPPSLLVEALGRG